MVFCALLEIQMYENSGSPSPMPPPQPIGAPKSGITPTSVFGELSLALALLLLLSLLLLLALPAEVSPVPSALSLTPLVGEPSVADALALALADAVIVAVADALMVAVAVPVPLMVSSRPPLSPQPITAAANTRLESSFRIA